MAINYSLMNCDKTIVKKHIKTLVLGHAKVFEHSCARACGAPYGGAAALTRPWSKHRQRPTKKPSGAFFYGRRQ
jgi:hypothetical protein